MRFFVAQDIMAANRLQTGSTRSREGCRHCRLICLSGLCVLSRAAALAGSPGEQGAQAVAIARVFAQQAKRRMANSIRRAERNEDEEMNKLAGFIFTPDKVKLSLGCGGREYYFCSISNLKRPLPPRRSTRR